LTATAVTAGGVVAGVATDRALTDSTTTPSPASDAQGNLSPTVGTWQSVVAAADLPEGAVLPFDLGAVTGFVQRVSGRVQAVSGICTHQGCRLDLEALRDQLACPCHGAPSPWPASP
jgi:Rieske Fe-S protein